MKNGFFFYIFIQVIFILGDEFEFGWAGDGFGWVGDWSFLENLGFFYFYWEGWQV